jgi:hypothetical protein
MVVKTLLDCSHCPYLTECDAHISDGTHRHREKPDPCKVDFNPKENNPEENNPEENQPSF